MAGGSRCERQQILCEDDNKKSNGNGRKQRQQQMQEHVSEPSEFEQLWLIVCVNTGGRVFARDIQGERHELVEMECGYQ